MRVSICRCRDTPPTRRRIPSKGYPTVYACEICDCVRKNWGFIQIDSKLPERCFDIHFACNMGMVGPNFCRRMHTRTVMRSKVSSKDTLGVASKSVSPLTPSCIPSPYPSPNDNDNNKKRCRTSREFGGFVMKANGDIHIWGIILAIASCITDTLPNRISCK